MRIRLAIATGITAALFGAYLASSGAPLRVHVAWAMGLLVGFWVPALLVGSPRDVRVRGGRVLAVVFLGAITLALGQNITIAKANITTAIAQVVVSVPILVGLLAVHGFIVQRATRREAV